MDMAEPTNDFQDWELLQTNSDPVSSPDSGNPFDHIHSGGLIQADYFSLDPHVEEEERMDDDRFSGWIDPDLTRAPIKESGDSGTDRSEDRKFSELEETSESGFPVKEEEEPKFELTEEEVEDLENYMMGTGSGGVDGDSAKFSDVAEDSQVGVDFHVESQVLGEEINVTEGIESGDLQIVAQVFGEENEGTDEVTVDARGQKNNNGEIEKRGVVWWKMPMEFLKYCMIRMSPVWTVSVAAAVVGFVILGRRLHKMRRKARGLEIKVAVDDKKASQAMSRAARLNEAFSVVKLVPVIRPSLPAVGSSSNWTVMSLR